MRSTARRGWFAHFHPLVFQKRPIYDDVTTDTFTIILNAEAEVAESDEDKPGVILDYDHSGNFVSLEIFDASKRVSNPRRIEFETVG
jgi:uncharacterized protein YuzE